MVNAAAFFEYPLDITVANRTNEVIKALTILGTIAPPVLCISGIHSMNLKDRPFEEFPYGAEWAAAVTIVATCGPLYYLRKRKWF
jgi:magnesium transporter